MKKFIVTTTIFSPSEAIIKYSNMKDWTLVVVGDKKTPHSEYEKIENIIYLHPKAQEDMYKKLSDSLGWNCIQRRNIGFVYAYHNGADIIASVDDDNIPLENWGKDLFLCDSIEVDSYECEKCDFFDPLSVTSRNELWHRGFPIKFVKQKNTITKKKEILIPSFQGNLWNGEADVDAIERMLFNTTCDFSKDKIFPFTSSQKCPFNSQNTFIHRRAIKDYFCFPFVGRMDDIWGAYVALSKGHRVIFDKPTVYQERNEHDNIMDFKNEILGYINNHDFNEKIIPESSMKAYEIYQSLF